MGNFKKNMRAAIFIFALLGLTLTARVMSEVGTNNSLDVCLKDIKAEAHQNLQALSFGLKKNWLEMAQQILASGADAIQSYEDCMKVQPQDALMWVLANCDAKTQACITYAGMAAASVKNAMNTKKMADVITAV